MNHYLIIFTPPRDTFLSDSTQEENIIVGNHFEYLKKLHAENILTLAGRTDDAEMGLLIIKADNEAEAKKIVESDPAVVGGVFSYQIKLYRLALLGQM